MHDMVADVRRKTFILKTHFLIIKKTTRDYLTDDATRCKFQVFFLKKLTIPLQKVEVL